MIAAKAMARGLGVLLAWPYLIGYWSLRSVVGPDHALTTAVEGIARVPGVFGVYARQAFYRRVLDRVGQDVYFGFLSLVSKQAAVIGDRVYIGRFCTIGYAHLGDDVMLADGVQVLSGRHQHGDASRDGQAWRANPQNFELVKIGSGAWLGAGAVVMADVGERAVVGAGAVVVKPVPPGERVGGVPARPLGGNR